MILCSTMAFLQQVFPLAKPHCNKRAARRGSRDPANFTSRLLTGDAGLPMEKKLFTLATLKMALTLRTEAMPCIDRMLNREFMHMTE